MFEGLKLRDTETGEVFIVTRVKYAESGSACPSPVVDFTSLRDGVEYQMFQSQFADYNMTFVEQVELPTA